MVDPVNQTVESTGDTSLVIRRKRRREAESEETGTSSSIGQDERVREAKRWRTEREQQIYSLKLAEALRRVRRRSCGVRDVREAADRVLAVSARGTTRWSRAILANRVRTRLKNHRKAKLTRNNPVRRLPEITAERSSTVKLSEVDRKLKILGRLVPGCRKVSVPDLLEETTDYIAAMVMQVRAMTALAELLTTAPPPSPASTGP